jgi:DNA-binding IscR family transcriptional regulator
MLYGCVVCRNRDEYDVRTAQGFVIDGKGIKGSRGGYILNKKPEKITLKEIIDALDPSVLGSDVAVVNDENTEFAQVLDDYIWLRLENKLKSYTESITLRQLVDFYNKESVENVSEPMYYI